MKRITWLDDGENVGGGLEVLASMTTASEEAQFRPVFEKFLCGMIRIATLLEDGADDTRMRRKQAICVLRDILMRPKSNERIVQGSFPAWAHRLLCELIIDEHEKEVARFLHREPRRAHELAVMFVMNNAALARQHYGSLAQKYNDLLEILIASVPPYSQSAHMRDRVLQAHRYGVSRHDTIGETLESPNSLPRLGQLLVESIRWGAGNVSGSEASMEIVAIDCNHHVIVVPSTLALSWRGETFSFSARDVFFSDTEYVFLFDPFNAMTRPSLFGIVEAQRLMDIQTDPALGPAYMAGRSVTSFLGAYRVSTARFFWALSQSKSPEEMDDKRLVFFGPWLDSILGPLAQRIE